MKCQRLQSRNEELGAELRQAKAQLLEAATAAAAVAGASAGSTPGGLNELATSDKVSAVRKRNVRFGQQGRV